MVITPSRKPHITAAAHDDKVIAPSRKPGKYDDESELPTRGHYNLSDAESIENVLENRTYVPNNNNGEQRKFKPTAATANRLKAKAMAANFRDR